MKIFEELGDTVESRWKDANYDEDAFPAIAAQALSEANLCQKVDAWDTLRWVFSDQPMPLQDIDSTFGDPPITLYRHSRFCIDIYFWLDGTTAVHMHSFCGAFQVLMGSSIHSHYTFEPKRRINDQLLFGDVRLKNIRLLNEGDIKQILFGERFIHSLFHLDRPSATITIRTSGSPSRQSGIQYSYLLPCIAFNQFYRNPQLTRKGQSANLLLQAKHPNAHSMIGELIADSDFQTAYTMLHLAFFYYGSQNVDAFQAHGKEKFQELLDSARKKHGEDIGLLPLVFEEIQRQQYIIRKRGLVTEKDHRFFLALLLNVPDKVKLLDLVRQRFPDNPPAVTVVNWIEELADTSVLNSTEPNLLGIPDFDDLHLLVVQYLLEDLPLEQINREVSSRYHLDPDSIKSKVTTICKKLRSAPLLKAILG